MTPTNEIKQPDANASADLRENLLRDAFYLLLKMDEKQIYDALQYVIHQA